MKYDEIMKLKKMMEDANIPFTFETRFDGYQIKYYGKDKNGEDKLIIDAIEFEILHDGKDLIEIMLGDEVRGYLNAEEAFEYFKFCHNLSEIIIEIGKTEESFKDFLTIIYDVLL